MTEKNHFDHVKSRFCPSPTGLMHLGNARTALFNYLFALHAKGTFLLRIEDTDKERSKEEYTKGLMRDLQWLGLNWQEGPNQDQGLGPYHQSKRQAIYDDYYTRLEAMELAYPCFCSEDDLTLMRKVQRAQNRPPRYVGTCANLNNAERQAKFDEGMKPTLRFRVPEDEVIEFDDVVRGLQRFESSDIGDFIIRRANGTSPFMFCNAIDDALMEVTHVLRGEDHLTNTPRQLMILQALGLPIPIYGHIALIVGSDGSPLSKRHGSRSIEELHAQGYLAGALTNYLARLGHYYGHDEYLSLAELAAQFKLESLNRSPAKYNQAQLHYWQNEAIARLDQNGFYSWADLSARQIIPEGFQQVFFETIQPNVKFPKDVLHWANVLFTDNFTINGEATAIIVQAGAQYFKVALEAFAMDADVKTVMEMIKTELDLKGKSLYQPLRVALTGEQHGPEMGKLVAMINAEEITRRLEQAANCRVD